MADSPLRRLRTVYRDACNVLVNPAEVTSIEDLPRNSYYGMDMQSCVRLRDGRSLRVFESAYDVETTLWPPTPLPGTQSAR